METVHSTKKTVRFRSHPRSNSNIRKLTKIHVSSFLFLILFGTLLYLTTVPDDVVLDGVVVLLNESLPNVTETPPDPPLPCHVEEWNTKRTVSVPDQQEYEKMTKLGVTWLNGMMTEEIRLLSALVYDDLIVVTTTHQDKKEMEVPVYCRYFDCNRREIPDSQFQSVFSPMTVVQCARQIGAEYMSVSFGLNDTALEPVPIVKRLFGSPPHEIGVCVGQIYGGDERKWLEIIEYVEHHRLIGATMFYFTVFEMDGYTKKVMEEYQRLGLAEVTFVNTEFRAYNFLFQQIQLAECFFRSRSHSRWVINVDIDERLTFYKQNVFRTFLRNLDPSICELVFSNRRVPKMERNPKYYQTEEKLMDSLIFLRYHNMTDSHWIAPKIMYRPEKIFMIYMHWTWRQRSGCRIASIPAWVAYMRHYRVVHSGLLGSMWLGTFNTSYQFPLNSEFAEKLKLAVVNKVKYLYDVKTIPCRQVDPFYIKIFGKNTMRCTDNKV